MSRYPGNLATMGWIGFLGVLSALIGAWHFFLALFRPGPLKRFQRLVVGLIFSLLATLALGLATVLRSFEAFAGSRPVARVQCRWVGEKTFELQWTALRDGELVEPLTIQLKGNQWSVSGGIVKWHPWLTALGLPSYHKVTRLSGRYALIEEETAAPPTAVELNGGVDRWWEWLYRVDPYLPFIEAAYGSAAFLYVNPVLEYQVDVTPSGYLIRSLRKSLPLRR